MKWKCIIVPQYFSSFSHVHFLLCCLKCGRPQGVYNSCELMRRKSMYCAIYNCSCPDILTELLNFVCSNLSVKHSNDELAHLWFRNLGLVHRYASTEFQMIISNRQQKLMSLPMGKVKIFMYIYDIENHLF